MVDSGGFSSYSVDNDRRFAKALKKAYEAIGSKYYDFNHGDLRSQEHPAVNTASPIQGFKGYPR